MRELLTMRQIKCEARRYFQGRLGEGVRLVFSNNGRWLWIEVVMDARLPFCSQDAGICMRPPLSRSTLLRRLEELIEAASHSDPRQDGVLRGDFG